MVFPNPSQQTLTLISTVTSFITIAANYCQTKILDRERRDIYALDKEKGQERDRNKNRFLDLIDTLDSLIHLFARIEQLERLEQLEIEQLMSDQRLWEILDLRRAVHSCAWPDDLRDCRAELLGRLDRIEQADGHLGRRNQSGPFPAMFIRRLEQLEELARGWKSRLQERQEEADEIGPGHEAKAHPGINDASAGDQQV